MELRPFFELPPPLLVAVRTCIRPAGKREEQGELLSPACLQNEARREKSAEARELTWERAVEQSGAKR